MLPPEAKILTGRVRHVVRHSAVHYTSTCPWLCDPGAGGEIHPNGDVPDRLQIWLDPPRIWCRKCGQFRWIYQLTGVMPTQQEREEWAESLKKQEEERRVVYEQALLALRQSGRVERYVEQCFERGVEKSYWEPAGISPEWVVNWSLGYDSRRESVTIPYFDAEGKVLDVKHRWLNPPKGFGKYFSEVGYNSNVFRVFPTAPPTEYAIFIEGEKKAMVFATRYMNSDVSIFGLPGIRPSPAIRQFINSFANVLLILDPEVTRGIGEEVKSLLKGLKPSRLKLLIPRAKIDDAIVRHNLSHAQLSYLMRNAEEVNG